MFTFALSLFQALAAIPKILGYLQDFAGGVMAWYVNQAEQKTLQMINDAAAFAARAKTKEDRLMALDKWKEAMSRPRYTP